MTNEEIIKGCIRQNRAAQEMLYSRYSKTLFVMCLKYCHNKAEAEDVLHDAFLTIFTSIKNYKGNGSFEGWMKRIAINKAVDKFKSSLESQPLDHVIYPVTDKEIEIETERLSMDMLLQFIQELPDQYRLVFNLYELDNYSHTEIAQMLAIAEGTSKSNLHKAKALLKNRINALAPKKYKNGI